ncbi:Signal recognition particle receptor subunit alpha, partial [Tetrabaena socialis]
ARGKPYVIVFCGVNGVGKSTNLAKIAYWLGGHGIKVMIAACDTFRAGAVEQLKTHCARLRAPLYERGYEKDPAKVAYEAVRQAERDGIHVVLVDTAGRMQDNQPLMRALSNLIAINDPNLVLFVGEALVGNDAVDQLMKFNKSLSDLAPTSAAAATDAAGGGPRGAADGSALVRRHGGVIDGIVLTKFDTIDEKVRRGGAGRARGGFGATDGKTKYGGYLRCTSTKYTCSAPAYTDNLAIKLSYDSSGSFAVDTLAPTLGSGGAGANAFRQGFSWYPGPNGQAGSGPTWQYNRPLFAALPSRLTFMVRSSADPWIAYTGATRGSGDFGRNK